MAATGGGRWCQFTFSAALNTFLGFNSLAMRAAMAWNAWATSLSGWATVIGVAVVAAFAQLLHERQLAQQRHAELVGELLAAARPEDLVPLAVVAGEPAHVLDDALHGQVHLLRHRGRQPRHLLRCRLRGGDHVHLTAGQVLAEAERDVAGAGRHVDEQEVGVVPEHVGEELLERLVQHRAAPDDRLALGHEVADGDAA